MKFIFPLIFLIGCLQLYFFLARKFNIIDNPNQRSSHAHPTVRGGGVVFSLAILLYFFLKGFNYPWFVAGTIFIATISFADDLKPLPALIRLGFHLLAFLALSLQLALFDYSWWMVGIVFLVGIGTLNAFNFMDGINGITGVYSLVTLLSLWLINFHLIRFTDDDLILYLVLSVVVFLFYNFRHRAQCFAGDVGSISIAFALIFLLLQLITSTAHFGWIILFAVYGVDAVLTILYRLINRENIFRAHRSHLYQYLANELKLSHQMVSVSYGILQVLINLWVIYYLGMPTVLEAISITLVLVVVYIAIRESILVRLGKRGLILNRYHKDLPSRHQDTKLS